MFANEKMPQYQDPNGRCGCVNSDIRGDLGPKLAACFDSNCSNPSAYQDEQIRTATRSSAACAGLCSSIQLCFSDDCVQNQTDISSTCSGSSAPYSATQFKIVDGNCVQCDDSKNCEQGDVLFTSLGDCSQSTPTTSATTTSATTTSTSTTTNILIVGGVVAAIILIVVLFYRKR